MPYVFHFVSLMSLLPDQNSLLKIVAMLWWLVERQMILNAAYWPARGTSLSSVVQLAGCSFTPAPNVWVHTSDGEVGR